ncbi:hypothetical protein B0H34DRAFT_246156 [Crassisporium funariophilum]|nr:hypothetical protein B0H34DRAFT_246156 [Crassisporium funariophilum]
MESRRQERRGTLVQADPSASSCPRSDPRLLRPTHTHMAHAYPSHNTLASTSVPLKHRSVPTAGYPSLSPPRSSFLVITTTSS